MPPYNPETDTPQKAARRRWYHANHDYSLRDMKRRRDALKDECYKAYGGYRCSCCGETEESFLCLDHVASDGYKHRKEIGSRGGIAIYYWIRKNNFPPGMFQVYCFNCNQSKRINGGTCAHQNRTNKMAHEFEKSMPHHVIHEMHRPDGHAHLDQKYDKGMRSPMTSQLPMEAGLESPSTTVEGGSGHGDSGYTNGGAI